MKEKKHLCPDCGSEKIESYKDETTVYLKCDSCGKTLSSHRLIRMHHGNSAIPVVMHLLIFAILYALGTKALMAYMSLVM